MMAELTKAADEIAETKKLAEKKVRQGRRCSRMLPCSITRSRL
jgi:hypothetical protein